ncbi:glycosyltransferase family 2 protein [Mucilaginibacter arboris]|uniref:Glycosyltransferase n=1 Tax=Mucilaginibacter arboris TaxID=2682090 RepID=A0A7K1SY42_9SPHI|nr:glycosyltransferase family 2 protein [Mucilaginibacter arboris]MVN22239.1 glycosyltransferase [Mucilaginibacter arboris]
MDNYRLSIALVTRNRPDLLETCLKSLYQQPHIWSEIVISDDSSTEEFILQNRNLSNRYDAKYLEGPKKGLYANRNFVAKSCGGTHIRTMDDDHTFPQDHLKICLDKIAEDPDAIWVIGEYNTTETPLPPPHPVPSEIHPRGFSITPKDPQNSRAISCGASIYPQKVITSNILNNEDFKFGSVYLEYGSRLKYLGFRIRHISETYVIHNFNFNTRSYNNDTEILNSNIYAMLTLSFVYEPTVINKFYTISQLTYYLTKDYQVVKKLIGENWKRVQLLKIKLRDFKHLN